MPEKIESLSPVPRHIGIIMDGNGRWAKKRNLPRTMGHKEGLEAARRIMLAAANCGVQYLTLYTFSTENWKRTKDEVGFLMNLIRLHLKTETEFYRKENIRLYHLGDLNGLPEDIQKDIATVMQDSKNNTRLNLILAINYGGKNEIIRAVKKVQTQLLNDVSSNSPIHEVTEENFSSYFDIPDIPDVDMIIRTGGEKRLSNFLLWHGAYSELYFSDTLWPEYSTEEFLSEISDFQKRNRRFGGL